MNKVYNRIESIAGSVITVKAIGIQYNELAVINTRFGKSLAQVIKIENDLISLQVFAGGRGVSTGDEVRFLGNEMRVSFSDDLLGRIFNGSGEPRDKGPVLTENLGYYINLYDIWSSYKTEEEGVVIAYTSVYGNTKKAVEYLESKLKEKNIKVTVNDLARCDMAEAVEDAFRYDKIVLATTTYNNDIFPFMKEFINHLTERNFQNKTVAFIENGSWAPVATKVMKGMLENSKNINYLENNVKILSAINSESKNQLDNLADELI